MVKQIIYILILLVLLVGATADLHQDLYAVVQFEDNLLDTLGNLNFSVTGEYVFENFIKNKSIKITGDESYIESLTNTGITGDDPHSICFWVELTNFLNGAYNHFGSYGQPDIPNSIVQMYVDRQIPEQYTGVTFWGGGVSTNYSIWAFNTYFLCYVYDSTTYKIYVDGSKQAEVDVELELQDTPIMFFNLRGYINHNLGANGYLDEVYIWKRALTDEEVTELWNNGSGFYYPFGLCIPDWVCNGYEECVKPMTQASCNSVIDLNSCGESYGGDYSEFEPLICVYEPEVNNTYVPRYSSGDLIGVVVDNIVEVGVQIIRYVPIIVLVVLVIFLTGL